MSGGASGGGGRNGAAGGGAAAARTGILRVGPTEYPTLVLTRAYSTYDELADILTELKPLFPDGPIPVSDPCPAGGEGPAGDESGVIVLTLGEAISGNIKRKSDLMRTCIDMGWSASPEILQTWGRGIRMSPGISVLETPVLFYGNSKDPRNRSENVQRLGVSHGPSVNRNGEPVAVGARTAEQLGFWEAYRSAIDDAMAKGVSKRSLLESLFGDSKKRKAAIQCAYVAAKKSAAAPYIEGVYIPKALLRRVPKYIEELRGLALAKIEQLRTAGGAGFTQAVVKPAVTALLMAYITKNLGLSEVQLPRTTAHLLEIAMSDESVKRAIDSIPQRGGSRRCTRRRRHRRSFRRVK